MRTVPIPLYARWCPFQQSLQGMNMKSALVWSGVFKLGTCGTHWR
jgi:hypothetical protein